MPVNTQETRFLLSAKDKTKVAFKGAKMNLNQVGKAVTGVQSRLLALAGIGGFGALVSGIIDTNQEMQRLQSSLLTVTGSSEGAATAFAKIKKFAVTTPFDLNQWTEAFIKMKSLGLDPSEKALNSYGNTAAAMGKDLNQMIEAVADAATGEFERLKEFGIKARKQGDEVSFVFQGVTTTVGNNAREIEQFLQSIGDNQFGTAMKDQMGNLGPAFSNLKQSFSELAVKIGEAGLNGMVTDLTHSITDFVNSFNSERLLTIERFFKGVGDAFAAVADVWNAIVFLQGNDMLQNFLGSNPSQVGNGGAALPGGFQLGAFNNSGGDFNNAIRQQAFDQANPEEAKRTREAVEKNNEFQAQILQQLKDQQNTAVAG